MAVEPLTQRSSRDGKVYHRVAEVETQLEGVEALDWPDLVDRLSVKSRSSPRYLREETLVYLCRRAHARGTSSDVSSLYRLLLARIQPGVESKLSGLDEHRREGAAEAVRNALAGRIFDLSTNRGDFLQVIFFQGLTALILTEVARQRKEQERERRSVSLDAASDADESEASAPMEAEVAQRVNRNAPDRAAAIHQGLALIKDDRHRMAFVLRYHERLPVAEVAARMGVTPRTILNWLTAAQAILVAAHGDSYDHAR